MRPWLRLALLPFLLAIVATPLAARPLPLGTLKVESPAPPPMGRAEKLDVLFADLLKAPTLDDGRAIEAAIVQIWLQSGDEEVDRLMNWAITAMSIGSYQLALVYLDQVVVLKPDYAEVWNKRATVYYLTRDYDKSLADIDRTLALEPRHFGALAGRGLIRQAEGDLEGALDAFRAALALNPNLEDISNAVYNLEYELKKKQRQKQI